ncbi:hypothetical protein [Mucilaginibacter lacusdianchii]|uniref:hypothetical protein n=1 Tax=Mucilaginibacter lacusdianchii TaxID=2684211 RepID=UPI00131ECA2A|nr:hypothetical protein [Mucilaginibacter sp. JXJ CY 39]
MKNILKLAAVAMIAISFTACQGNGNGNRGTMDSVATRNDSNGTSTTVDTQSRVEADSLPADTMHK